MLINNFIGEFMRGVHSQWAGAWGAKAKLFWLVQGLRALSAAYVAWVLVRIVSWWPNGPSVVENMGRYLERDLSALTQGARMLAMSMDLVSWLLLLLSVVCCWKALGVLVREYTFTPRMARLLTLGGWLGGACLLLAVLSRPVNSYLMTWHLPAAEQVFKWNFYPQDVMSAMLCGSLLCLGYIIAWAQEIAEENRGFV